MQRFTLSIGLLLLASCATATPQIQKVPVSAGEAAKEGAFQRQLVLEQHFVDQHRLHTIRFHVGRGAAPYCNGQTRWNFGFAVANEYTFGPGQRRMMRQGFGYGERLQVLHVLPGAPAHTAGLRSGDVILSVNGVTLKTGPGAKQSYKDAKGLLGGKRLEMVIDADGPKKATMSAVEICDFDINLTQSHRVRAFARGENISVSKGMLWFASDPELAFVIAHELVHVLRKHGRIVGRQGVDQKDLEAEADYLGLYFMARGGYEIGEAPRFWRRIAANFPQMLNAARTHPATSYRFVAMQKAVAEIQGKIAAGQPLIPLDRARLADAAQAR